MNRPPASPPSGPDPDLFALASQALMVAVLCLTAAALHWLAPFAPPRPAFVVMPLFHPGREPAWREFEATARTRLARGRCDDATRKRVQRGREAMREVYRLRNETHHLNRDLCDVGAGLLGDLTRRQQQDIATSSERPSPAPDSLQALETALAGPSLGTIR